MLTPITPRYATQASATNHPRPMTSTASASYVSTKTGTTGAAMTGAAMTASVTPLVTLSAGSPRNGSRQ